MMMGRRRALAMAVTMAVMKAAVMKDAPLTFAVSAAALAPTLASMKVACLRRHHGGYPSSRGESRPRAGRRRQQQEGGGCRLVLMACWWRAGARAAGAAGEPPLDE